MLEQRSLTILEFIMGNPSCTINDLQLKTSLSRRQIMYDLEKINYWLKKNNFEEIKYCRKNGLKMTETPSNVVSKLAQEKSISNYNEKDRRLIIFFYLLISKEEVSLYHLTDLLRVSRGTVHEDLKKLVKELQLYDLQITYKRIKGYFIDGKEANIRYAAMYLIGNIIIHHKQRTISLDYVLEQSGILYKQIFHVIRKHFVRQEIVCSDNGLLEVMYIIIFCMIREQDVDNRQDLVKLTSMPEYEVARLITEDLLNLGYPISSCYVNFIASLILSYSFGQADMKNESFYMLKDFVYKIFYKLEITYGIALPNKKEAFQQIYAHFKPAYYRIIFNYPIVNPLKDKIKAKYNSLFKILKEIFYPISLPGGSRFSDNEIAYLTIHFATLIKHTNVQSTSKVKAGIVCPNGTGISLIIYKELKGIFPEVEFLKPTSIDQLSINDEVDVVFSTKLIQTSKPLFIVSPMMTNLEKANLIKSFYRSIGNSVYIQSNFNISEKDLLYIVNKYTSNQNAKKLVTELKKLLAEVIYIDGERRQPMLSEIINKDLIQLKVQVKDWKDAIKKSSRPLVEQHIVTTNYVNAMVASAEENGPYIVITKHVALPHARPEAGANKIGISLTTLKTPVSFGNKDNDPVKYVFCLSAVDSITHLKAITELVELLESNDFYDLLESSSSKEEIIDYIKKSEVEMSNE